MDPADESLFVHFADDKEINTNALAKTTKQTLPEEHPISDLDPSAHRIWTNRGMLAAPICLLFGLAVGSYMPCSTEFIKHQVCTVYLNYSQEMCRTIGDPNNTNTAAGNKVRSETSNFLLYCAVAAGIPGIIFSLFLGSWSDRYGRKAPMLIPVLGMLFSTSLVVMTVYLNLAPIYQLIPSFLSSAFGGWTVLLMGIFSYVGDHTSERNRSTIISISMGCLGIGMAIGNSIGSALLGRFGFAAPFITTTTIHGIISVYIIFLIKDHHRFDKVDTKLVANLRQIFETKSLKDNWTMLREWRPNGARLHIVMFLISYTAATMCAQSEQSLVQLLVEFHPLSWSIDSFTWFQSISGIINLVGLSISLPLLKRFLRMSDLTIGVLASVSGILRYYGLAIAFRSWIVYSTVAVGIFGQLSMICMQSLLIGLVSREETGKILSIVGSIQAISTILSSLVFVELFSVTAAWWPGFVFAVEAFALVIPLVSFCYIDIMSRTN